MLPPFIIQQIRQREEKARQKPVREQPRLELPIDQPTKSRDPEDEDDPDRGVVILDVMG